MSSNLLSITSFKFYSKILLLIIVVALLVRIISPYSEAIENLFINQGWKSVPQHTALRFAPIIVENVSTSSRFDSIKRLGAFTMAHSSATFIGVTKNVDSNLPNLLHQIEILSNYFTFTQSIFVDGGSTDRTMNILKHWTNRSRTNRTLLTLINDEEEEVYLPNFNHTKLPREGRIAAARNLALKVYREQLNFTSVIVVLDLDIVGFSIDGILDSFGRLNTPPSQTIAIAEPAWDVVCANGILLHGIYRDTYAFRTAEVDNNHHFCGDDHLSYNISKRQRIENRRQYQESKARTQVLLDRSLTPLLPVDSCFGGMAIYRHEVIARCDYRYRLPQPPHMLDCEHVLFHSCLRKTNHARIFVNTHMTLWYGHSTMKHINLRKEIIRWLQQFLYY